MKRCREQAQRLVKAMPSFHRRSTTMKYKILAVEQPALAVAHTSAFLTTTTATVQAGIPVIDGGNQGQNIMTASESGAQTLKQIEQYQTQLQQYVNQLENTEAPAAYVWDEAQ